VPSDVKVETLGQRHGQGRKRADLRELKKQADVAGWGPVLSDIGRIRRPQQRVVAAWLRTPLLVHEHLGSISKISLEDETDARNASQQGGALDGS
jgi:hypothetical protein